MIDIELVEDPVKGTLDLGFGDVFEADWEEDEVTTVPYYKNPCADLDVYPTEGGEEPEEEYSDGGIMQEQYGEEFEV